jgi:hypothetical protein
LARGDKVTAVGRTKDDEGRMDGWHGNCQGLVCDVRVEETVLGVMQKALINWGTVDVVVKWVVLSFDGFSVTLEKPFLVEG